eukprot:CAMPEP_0183477748 /NCGR_PEP_ID=MMETSP0370-20130417/168707_1 /TAXON_ID=268820 /ORGANISM="Peridinium aciculiferum, Strain PAER-2" /LENGTH=137 /DNA_ID=CAMNT_0025670667 /DNA_START=429 /DNA_END=842 /DNA_ORIENTATION=+
MVVWTLVSALGAAILPAWPCLQGAAGRGTLLGGTASLVAPAELKAAIPADRHALVDVPEPKAVRDRRPMTLRDGTPRPRDLHNFEVHGVLREGFRHLVPVRDLHASGDRPVALLDVPGQSYSKVAIGTNMDSTMIYH